MRGTRKEKKRLKKTKATRMRMKTMMMRAHHRLQPEQFVGWVGLPEEEEGEEAGGEGADENKFKDPDINGTTKDVHFILVKGL